MSSNKMLIDAAHPEETRVVVVRGGTNRIEEFDFESQDKKQLKGNIYLARVTRVEPSLQAAFVEYGGNRHGFLAFSEIHPDYYQIPVADRQALLRAEAAEAEEEDEDDEDRERGRGRNRRRRGGKSRDRSEDVVKAAQGSEAAGQTEYHPAEEDHPETEGFVEESVGESAASEEPAVAAAEAPSEPASADAEDSASSGDASQGEAADQGEAGDDDNKPSGGTTSIAAAVDVDE